VQIPPLVAQAQARGVVRIVGSGVNRWSNVHVDDVVDLYARALAGAPAGSFYFVENGEASYAEIGDAIARRLGLGPVQSWTVAEAAKVWGEGHARYSFGSNSRVRVKRARAELGWAPRHASVTQWIEAEDRARPCEKRRAFLGLPERVGRGRDRAGVDHGDERCEFVQRGFHRTAALTFFSRR